MKEIRKVLEKLWKQPDEDDPFYKYDKDRVDASLAEIKKIFLEWIGEDKECSTPNHRPAQYVSHDMAMDAQDMQLEGSIYTEETYQECGGCPECVYNQAKAEMRRKVEL